MDLMRTMRTFVRVVDEQGFAAAARSLDLAPAVVTKQVADLEAHLGARLLNRTTRRMSLTDVGETYLDHARQILADVEEAEALAARSVKELRGHLKVLVPPAFAVHQLAKRLPAFRARHPHVTLELTVPGPVESVDEAHDVSILMTGYPLSDGDFVARRIAVSEIIVCAAPDYLDRVGRLTHPSHTLGIDLLLPSVTTARRVLSFTHLTALGSDGQPERVDVAPPPPAMTTTHLDTTYAAVLAGMGVAGLPSFVVADALMEHALERLLPDWRIFALTIYAGVPTRKHLPARTRAFIDFLIETFGGGDRDTWLEAAGCPTVPIDPSAAGAPLGAVAASQARRATTRRLA
jgi:DNA-binding transcriptional LysR family regulator